MKTIPFSKARAGWLLLAILALIPLILWQMRVATQARRAAVSIQERADRILDALPVGVVVCDEAGTMRFVNYEATRMLGWSSRELVGRKLQSILPDERARQQKFIAELKEVGGGDFQVTKTSEAGTAITSTGERLQVTVRWRAFLLRGQIEQIATIGHWPQPEKVEPIHAEPLLKPDSLLLQPKE